MTKKKDVYEKFAGEFLPPERIAEELEAEGIDVADAEKEHFEEED